MKTERYVAVDNVCAWPNLTAMPDGSIVAAIHNQPTHGGWEADVECWASTDQGRMWRLRGAAAPHDPGANRMNAAAGLARDGSLVVLASGFGNRTPPGRYTSPKEGTILPPVVCRSSDGGLSWSRTGSVSPALIPFGDVVRMADGCLGACFYGCPAPGKNTAWFFASADDGRSWSLRGAVAEGDANETAPLVLADGNLIAAARTYGDQHLELYASRDHGATWTDRGALTLPMQHPGHLLTLQDGRVLLTYGIRNRGLYGVGARLSPDGGLTWQAPRILADFRTATDGGYPSSVQAEDGAVVTAYYCDRVPAHDRYHMGVVRWSVED